MTSWHAHWLWWQLAYLGFYSSTFVWYTEPTKQTMGESEDRLISNGDIQPHEANKSEKPPFVVDQTCNF